MDNLVMHGPMLASAMDALDEAFNVNRIWESDDQDAYYAANASTRFAATAKGFTSEMMDRLPALEVIASFGVGTDSIDLGAAKARNIRVTNTPDVLNDAVAELAFGLMLSLCRRIADADSFVRDGKWLDGGYPLTGELTGAKVGIIGLGRIGKEIANRCQAFKMQVSYHGRREQAFQPYPYYADLEEMARDVDWIIAVVPGDPSTAGMLSESVLKALGPTGAIVNVGRGSLIDEPAMLRMLKSGELGGAALDVFAEEPKMSEEMWGLSNVVLSPHQGSATDKTRWAMGDMVVRNLLAAKAGDPLISPVV